ncbi:MAG TPA: hypothetical protein VGN13_12330 [Solirubrobacteraceae bacterium]|jgi:hypothetical protein
MSAYTLAHVEWDGVWKTGKVWTLSHGQTVTKTWYWAPLAWVRVSCLLHGYGWPPAK